MELKSEQPPDVALQANYVEVKRTTCEVSADVTVEEICTIIPSNVRVMCSNVKVNKKKRVDKVVVIIHTNFIRVVHFFYLPKAGIISQRKRIKRKKKGKSFKTV